jgi:predicted nucleotide-binding protein
MKMRTRVLIGSSSEALPIARALQANLDPMSECTVWDQGMFRLSQTTIEGLVDALRNVEYAIFVFSNDDVTLIRGKRQSTTRDNVIFELGMAIGSLGRSNTFIVAPDASVGLHMPTDLLGISAATYRTDRSDQNLKAALGPAATAISQAMRLR